MDLNKLTLGDKVIAGSAILLLIGSFLPWFGFEECGGLCDYSGWDAGFLWAILPVLLGLAMLAVVAIRAFSPDTSLPDLPITWGQALLAAGALAALLVVLKLLIGEEVGGFGLGSVDLDRKYGLFISAIAAVGLAVGGFLKMKEGDDVNTHRGTTGGPPQSF